MKLIVEPEGGIGPILRAIAQAKSAIDIVIFRLDCRSVTRHLEDAVRRGVLVRAMIARKHRGHSRDLRKLERRLLRSGVILSRTAGDLVRYHGKMMIVDRRILHVYGFNYTRRDYESRSFGIETTDPALVREALKLFDADAARRPYRPGHRDLVVSPANSRERLAAFIRGARRQLLIYDPRFSDRDMHDLIAERSGAGVDVRVIGKVRHLRSPLAIEKFPGFRLHVRAIIRDGTHAFVGSQSLGPIELDRRREVGVIVRDAAIVRRMRSVFEGDWSQTGAARAAG
ncbi:MAG TPA: phospholipase D-like domain-containing protein [Vicinamibacterales bacterium]|nr:phospholipase D-like domain-containing protein [Vicinamibacterales bacterium]